MTMTTHDTTKKPEAIHVILVLGRWPLINSFYNDRVEKDHRNVRQVNLPQSRQYRDQEQSQVQQG